MSRLETVQLQQALKPRPRLLTIQEIQSTLPIPFMILDGNMVFERSMTTVKLRKPVKVELEHAEAVGDPQLLAYIVESCVENRGALMPFIIGNKTMVAVARYLKYGAGCSGSTKSLYNYAESVSLYCRFLEASPDRIIDDLKSGTNLIDTLKLQNHNGLLQQWAESLQGNGLSPSAVHGHIKHIRTFYRKNGGKDVDLPEKLSRKPKYKDEAPKPEHLAKMLEIADLREKVILTLPALGGFRQATLTKLEYRHVREDLESGRIPLHVHVEAEIVKGKYAEHDTFLGKEAVEYLRLYLEERRKGSPDGRRSPEVLDDHSPLIIANHSRRPRPITTKQIRVTVHNLYDRAGLLRKVGGRMYNYRQHGLRKFFKTQFITAGAPESHIQYWMGHVEDTYNHVHSLSMEKQRQEYAKANVTIKSTAESGEEAIEQLVKRVTEDPAVFREFLTRLTNIAGQKNNTTPTGFVR